MASSQQASITAYSALPKTKITSEVPSDIISLTTAFHRAQSEVNSTASRYYPNTLCPSRLSASPCTDSCINDAESNIRRAHRSTLPPFMISSLRDTAERLLKELVRPENLAKIDGVKIIEAADALLEGEKLAARQNEKEDTWVVVLGWRCAYGADPVTPQLGRLRRSMVELRNLFAELKTYTPSLAAVVREKVVYVAKDLLGLLKDRKAGSLAHLVAAVDILTAIESK